MAAVHIDRSSVQVRVTREFYSYEQFLCRSCFYPTREQHKIWVWSSRCRNSCSDDCCNCCCNSCAIVNCSCYSLQWDTSWILVCKTVLTGPNLLNRSNTIGAIVQIGPTVGRPEPIHRNCCRLKPIAATVAEIVSAMIWPCSNTSFKPHLAYLVYAYWTTALSALLEFLESKNV